MAVVAAALAGGAWGAAGPGFVSTRGRWLVDAQGRVLILHSMNVAQACKRPPFLPWQTKDDLAALRRWGFDSVRYLIVWEAVEPRPGEYDDAYLDQVAVRLRWCREVGLRVILDMHQDVYARKYGGDGAPDWACLDAGIPFQRIKGAWYMSYAAPAVIKAFDAFWANKPGPGRVGIQDRFIAAWQHVARRFRDDTNVVGYDLLNEPYYGSAAYPIFFALVAAVGQELGPEFQSQWRQLLSKPEGATPLAGQLVEQLYQRGKLLDVLDAASGPAMEFERRRLQPFYNKLVAAIREVDPHHICFFEPAGGSASGTRLKTGIAAPRDARGRPFANVAFAPHHYDFWFDLKLPHAGPTELVLPQLKRAADAGGAMDAPTWFGEWGALGAKTPGAEAMVRAQLDAFDDLLCGWAWWQYSKGFTKLPFRPLMGRPHAEIIAGVPTRMRCTDAAFELSFVPLPQGGETVIWVPPALRAETRVRLVGSGDARVRRDESGFVRVVCPAGARECRIAIALKRAE